MGKIVECVPNFSEGRDPAVIQQITDAIRSVEGILLKNVDMGADTNRTVVTFFGSPEAVEEAAFRAIATAAEVIDMRSHRGSHPRMGATDVCPFVPVHEVTMEECVAMARRLGERVGKELRIPVYLYEYAATRPERKNLAEIRRGEYEGLPRKIKDPAWAPDFGPAVFNPKSGATVLGARDFLIAYNINLNSRVKDHATDIAFELREKGRSVRTGNVEPFYYLGKILKHEPEKYACGTCLEVFSEPASLFAHIEASHGYDGKALYRLNDIDPDRLDGQSVKKPGLFPACKAIGWELPQHGRTQISINLTNFRRTPPHAVLEKARELAARRGLVVTGSEIVGLVPLEAMVEAGRFYLARQGRSTGVPLDDLLETAVQSMGLRDLGPFDVKERVIGYPKVPPEALIAKTTLEFVHEVSRDSPAPGGGSVAALSGALGAALASMVANLTVGKPGYEEAFAEMGAVAVEAQKTKDALLLQVDADTRAFNGYLEALRLPRNTEAEKAARRRAMQEGLKEAVAVPLQTAELCLRALGLCRRAAAVGNRNSVSDAGVGAHMAHAGVLGACLNVRINLAGIQDEAYAAEKRSAVEALEAEARRLLDECTAEVRGKIR